MAELFFILIFLTMYVVYDIEMFDMQSKSQLGLKALLSRSGLHLLK